MKRIAFISILLLCLKVAFTQNMPDSLHLKPVVNRKMLASAIITESAVYAGGLSFLSFIWYADHDRVPFHFYNDNSGYLQMDKMGHMFASYGESYVAYKWLRKAGVDKTKALIYGGTMGFLMQAPIEVFDGLYEGWGFSWGDIAANAAGSLFLIGQEALFDEQVIRHKISFYPSELSKNAYGYLGENAFENFFYDYNSHSHWFSFNANRLFLKDVLPPWVNIAVGYSADGMLGEFENRAYYRGYRLPEVQRTRQFLLSLDIDWQKIPTNSKFLKGFFEVLNFVKVPFPALEINSQGKFNAYWLYF
ncbi:MAG: YfiM family protein [Prolixibacteraceae bacterium]|nr:YfiM family protein [Prolixibacteraceae bacterium]